MSTGNEPFFQELSQQRSRDKRQLAQKRKGYESTLMRAAAAKASQDAKWGLMLSDRKYMQALNKDRLQQDARMAETRQSQKYRAEEAQKGRTFLAEQAGLGRTATAEQGALGRELPEKRFELEQEEIAERRARYVGVGEKLDLGPVTSAEDLRLKQLMKKSEDAATNKERLDLLKKDLIKANPDDEGMIDLFDHDDAIRYVEAQERQAAATQTAKAKASVATAKAWRDYNVAVENARVEGRIEATNQMRKDFAEAVKISPHMTWDNFRLKNEAAYIERFTEIPPEPIFAAPGAAPGAGTAPGTQGQPPKGQKGQQQKRQYDALAQAAKDMGYRDPSMVPPAKKQELRDRANAILNAPAAGGP